MKVLGNYQKKKMSLITFLLKNSNCPIHLPITMPKTDSAASVSFACSEKLQIAGRACVVESHFSKVRETSMFCNSVEKNLRRAWYVPKSDFSRNFEKSPFNSSCRFTVFSL